MPAKGGIDPAALAVASLAGAVTVLAPPGPWAPVSTLIGLTLLFVIFGYDVDPEREARQSLAFSASASVSCLLVLGWPLELAFRALLREGGGSQVESAVPSIVFLIVWAVLTGFIYLYDTRWR